RIKLIGMVMKKGASVNDRPIENAISAKLVACTEPELVQVCGVTINSSTGKNDIHWDKSGITDAAAYKIYRESDTPGKYNLLGTTLAGLPAVFTDASSDPSSRSYTYKIALVS